MGPSAAFNGGTIPNLEPRDDIKIGDAARSSSGPTAGRCCAR